MDLERLSHISCCGHESSVESILDTYLVNLKLQFLIIDKAMYLVVSLIEQCLVNLVMLSYPAWHNHVSSVLSISTS